MYCGRQQNAVFSHSRLRLTAINSTTVEVTYKEEIADIKSIDFKIEGLTVVDAVVKQTDKKTAVLTTSKQEGDKTYTVTAGDDVLGQFKGISDVVPTAIEVTTPSVQGTIGKEVTVHAKVTVPEGQSKAGIPVTFNIVNDKDNLNKTIEVEAKTNADGVASHSYTRYYEHNDSVTAYATEKSSVFSKGIVYWAAALTLTEVTEGNVLTNGAKKVYKVQTNGSYSTVYKPNSTDVDYNYVNVAFAENLNVSPDKLVRGVNVIDTGINNTTQYPYQVTTGGVNETRVKVDANGEATFTLTGANTSVTPIVFVDSNKDGKHAITELQAQATTVKFELSHTLGLDVKAEGVQNAAAINAEGTGTGGREYTVTVTDKDGIVAPEGSTAHVVFEKDSISKDRAVYMNGSATPVAVDTVYTITVGKDGKAKFTLTGQKDAFATPTVFLDNGEGVNGGNGKLDANDLQKVGEITYFVNVVVKNAELAVIDPTTGKPVTTLPTNRVAHFNYDSVDQNGFDYYVGAGDYEVSYEVTAQFADVTVSGAGLAPKLVKKGTTETVKVKSSLGKATLVVDSSANNVASNVKVNASASQVSLPNKSGAISFTKSGILPATHTGKASINTVDETITFAGFEPVSYENASFKNINAVTLSKAEFEALVLPNTGKAVVTYKKVGDAVTFEIVSLNADVAQAVEAINAATSAAGVVAALLANEGAFDSKWADLNTAQQGDVAAEVLTNRGSGYSEAGLKAAYETAYAAEVTTALANVATPTVVDAANRTITRNNLKAVPGLDISELGTGSFEARILNSVIALTPTSAELVSVDALQDFIDAQVVIQKDAEANQDKVDALAAINTGFKVATADAPTGPEFTAAKAALAANGATVGLDLTAFNAATTKQNAILTSLMNGSANADTAYTAASLQTAIDNAVAVATDEIAPIVTKATYDVATQELVFTFNEAVNADAAVGVITFNNAGLGGTTATADEAAKTGVTEYTFTLADGNADSFKVGSTITNITNFPVTDTAGNPLVLTGLDITVVTP